MLRNISNLGTTLNKSEQQTIKGGFQNDQETPFGSSELRHDPVNGGCVYSEDESLPICQE